MVCVEEAPSMTPSRPARNVWLRSSWTAYTRKVADVLFSGEFSAGIKFQPKARPAGMHHGNSQLVAVSDDFVLQQRDRGWIDVPRQGDDHLKLSVSADDRKLYQRRRRQDRELRQRIVGDPAQRDGVQHVAMQQQVAIDTAHPAPHLIRFCKAPEMVEPSRESLIKICNGNLESVI